MNSISEMSFRQSSLVGRRSSRARGLSRFSIRGRLGFVGCAVAAMIASGLATAQPVIVDDLVTNHRVNAPGGQQVAGSFEVAPGATMFGGWRNVYVRSDVTGTQTTSVSFDSERSIYFNNEGAATGLSRIIWDGRQPYVSEPYSGVSGLFDQVTDDPLDGYLDNNNNLVADLHSPPDPPPNFPSLRVGGSIDPTGLGGIDLTTTCLDSEPARFLLVLNAPDQGTYTVHLDVFTDGENWSRAELVVGENALDAGVHALAMPGSFTPQGNSGTTGADFTDVGAIVLSSFTTTPAVDTRYATPILVGCGYDFGDAPQDDYRTLGEGTGASGRGPHHLIGGPFLGLGSNDTDAEQNGQPSVGAIGDDSDGYDDEQALQTPPVFYADFIVDDENNPEAVLATCAGVTMGPNEYCVALNASNPTTSWAQIAGWIDFNASGGFDSSCAGNTDGAVGYAGNSGCERSAATLRVGAGGLVNAGENPSGLSCGHTGLSVGDPIGGPDWTSGNMPPGCEGVMVLSWDLNAVVDAEKNPGTGPILALEQTYARFRITTDPANDGASGQFFTANGPTPYGTALDGEIEDHTIEPGSLPVAISHFESRLTRAGLEVSWTTVSETENIGFYLWGDRGDGLDLLHEEMVPSAAVDFATPQHYSITLPIRGSVDQLAITAVDTRGREKMYGLYRTGESFGRAGAAEPVDWAAIRQQTESRLMQLGVERTAGDLLGRRVAQPQAADFAAVERGMQTISHEDLLSAGLDLSGVPVSHIAVTLKGQPVPRHIVQPEQARSGLSNRGGIGPQASFGPGSRIEFWGEMPDFPDALYVENYVYRVVVDSARVRSADQHRATAGNPGMNQIHTVTIDENLGYNPVNPNPDPFYAARLQGNDASPASYTVTIPIDQRADLYYPVELTVQVGGETDMPASPDHHVRLSVNGHTVKDDYFDGVVAHEVRLTLPAGVVQHGANQITVSAPGGTAAKRLDFFYVDSVSLSYVRQAAAENNAVLIKPADTDGSIGAYGFNDARAELSGYAWNGQRLWRLDAEHWGRGGASVARLPGASQAEYWISTGDALHRPEFVRTVAANTLFDAVNQADLVVITHPAFMPASEREQHPLNSWLDHRRGQGWEPVLVDILEIQNHYGGGMPLAEAVQKFLIDADQRWNFEHVLLVGDGTYDHLDVFDYGVISFIPSPYRATSRIRHTPADSMLTDLDGDGLSDKALGRWPVRTLDDLEAIVTKTMDWEDHSRQQKGAVWLTGRQDSTVSSFASQIERMVSPLIASGWPESTLDRIVFEQAGGAANTRNQFISALEDGRALSGFSGHAAPTMWSFDGVLAPADIAQIDNIGKPTLIGTLSCYTSYAASPHSNAIAHRMMNGYMVDSLGDRIPGAANGAVAIHGAATLSNLVQNEIVARYVLERQLEGMTLGEAVRAARHHAHDRGLSDQVINWTLLGDPSLRLIESNRARFSRGR